MIRRVLITGSRAWPKVYQRMISLALACELDYVSAPGGQLVVIHGACPTGVDYFADSWANLRQGNCPITVERHPAMWGHYGKTAGLRRNEHMVSLGADKCLAFIFEQSKGATHCAQKAERAGIKTVRFRIDVS